MSGALRHSLGWWLSCRLGRPRATSLNAFRLAKRRSKRRKADGELSRAAEGRRSAKWDASLREVLARRSVVRTKSENKRARLLLRRWGFGLPKRARERVQTGARYRSRQRHARGGEAVGKAAKI